MPAVLAVLAKVPTVSTVVIADALKGMTVAEQRLVLGYLRAAIGSDEHEIARMRHQLANFADHEGYTLDDVFVEVEASGSSALAALIEAARSRHPYAVLVPDLQHFGRLASVRSAVRNLVETRTGVPVLVAHRSTDSGEETLSADTG
jgi:hypothetical protein